MTSASADNRKHHRERPRFRCRFRLWRWPVLGMVFMLLNVSHAAEGQDLAEQVKTAFVLNFARFIQWPEMAFSTQESQLWLCIYGTDSPPLDFAQIENRVVNDRHIRVRQVSAISDAQRCHILFIDDQHAPHAMNAMANMSSAPVLTISNAPWFVREGGMISLYTRGRHVRFSINRTSARSAGLEISARLLQLAEEVR